MKNLKIYIAFLVGMIMQALIAIVADTVTYHVVVWQIAAGVLIAVAVFAGMWLSSPPEAPKRHHKGARTFDPEPIDDGLFEDITSEKAYDEFVKNL